MRRLKLDLEDERARSEQMELQRRSASVTGEPGAAPVVDEGDTKKLLHDYKFKLKKLEQENIVLNGNVSRLETQLARYKQASEEAEKLEDELKTEKRKILRDVSVVLSSARG